jgi:hypothetical protein
MGTLRNVLGIVSSLIAIGTLVFAIVTRRTADEGQLIDKAFLVLIATVVVLVCTIAWSTAKLQKEIRLIGSLPSDYKALKLTHQTIEKQLNELSDVFHSIAHLQRNVLCSINKTLSTKPLSKLTREEYIKISKQMNDFLSLFTNQLVSIIGDICGHRCSLCIKLCITSESDNSQSDLANTYVTTWYRDSKSFRRRKQSDYDSNSGHKIRTPVEKNTAFKRIVNPRERDSTYLRDNLIELAANGEYVNDNPQWKTLYTATAVVPICLPSGNSEHVRHVLGFLCVDNKGGGLQQERIENILCAFADGFYPLAAKYLEVLALANKNQWTDGSTRELPLRGDRGQVRSSRSAR